MPEQNNSSEGGKISRRNLLKLAGVVGAGAVLGKIGLSKWGEDRTAPETTSLERIREFIETKRPISFEQAKTIAPDIARFFTQSGSSLNPDEISKNIFFIRTDPALEEEFARKFPRTSYAQHPTFKQLLEDYPHLANDQEFLQYATYVNYDNLRRDISGHVENAHIYIFLPAINSPPGTLNYRGVPKKTPLQFSSTSQAECDPASPAVSFLTTLTHEMFHVEQSGEILKYGEEFIVQYLASKLSLENNLPVETSYRVGPSAVKNFSVILEQSGITDQELRRLHSSSQMKKLLVKVAEGADNITLNTEQEKIDFTTKLFKSFDRIKKPWEEAFKPYFPLVSSAPYEDRDVLDYRGCTIRTTA